MKTKQEILQSQIGLLPTIMMAENQKRCVYDAMDLYAKEVLVGYLTNRALMPENEALEEAEKYIEISSLK